MKQRMRSYWKRLRKVVAVVLAICCLVGTIEYFPFADVFAAPEVTDWTGDTTGQLVLDVSDLIFLDEDNKQLSCTPVPSDDLITYDLADYGFYEVDKLSMNLDFRVAKDGNDREIKSGDYFYFMIPQGLKLPEDFTTGAIQTANGLTIANYQKVQLDGGRPAIQYTFAELVDNGAIQNISGGMKLELEVDHDVLLSDGRTLPVMEKSGTTTQTTQVTFPEPPAKANGIQKTGVYNSQDTSIIWDIEVGTDRKCLGLQLNGLVLEDELGSGLTFGSATLLNSDGNAIDGGVSSEPLEGQNYKLTIEEDVQAPATVQVVTYLTKEKVEAILRDPETPGVSQLSNEVTMKTGEAVPVEGDAQSGSAQIEVTLEPGLEKHGMQIDSHTIRWTITVNAEDPRIHVYRGAVSDTLSPGLTYVDGSMTYTTMNRDGETTNQAVAAGTTMWVNPTQNKTDLATWPSNKLGSTLEEVDTKTCQKLTFYLDEDTWDAYTLVFDTSIDVTTYTNSDPSTLPEGGTAPTVTNEAIVSAQIPVGGPGTEPVNWDYGIPPATCGFYDSMVTKSVIKADTKTGIIEWQIEPSSRQAGYTHGVLTDVIKENQEYVAGSAVVWTREGNGTLTLYLSGEGTTDPNSKVSIAYAEGKKELTVTIKRGTGEKLADYVVTYKTKARDYFTKNNSKVTYSNDVKLEVFQNAQLQDTSTDSASVEMTNPFLKKSTNFEYDATTGYFHYTIEVNANALTVSDLVITDDLSQAKLYYLKDGSVEESLPGSYWTLDRAKTKLVKGTSGELSGTSTGSTEISAMTFNDNGTNRTVSFTGTGSSTEVKADLGTVSDKYTLHLYVKLKEAGIAKLTSTQDDTLKNVKIYSHNAVTVASDEVNLETDTNYPVVSDTKGTEEVMNNDVVAKSVAGTNTSEGRITWQILINPLGGSLGDSAVLTDTIGKAHKFIPDSVKLYKVTSFDKHDKVSGKEEVEIPEGTVGNANPKFWVDEEHRYMKVKLPENANEEASGEIYLLEYDTAILDAKMSSVDNSAKLDLGTKELDTGEGTQNITSGSWGTLTTVGNLELTKYDTSVGASMPLEGVKFEVYSDADCSNMVDVGVTDDSGKITFLGLDVDITNSNTRQDYWVKEISNPNPGYIPLNDAQKVTIELGKTTSVAIGNQRYPESTDAANSKVEIQKTYSYQGINGDVNNEYFASTFQVYFYPYGKDDSRGRKLVSFTQAVADSGIYQYCSNPGDVTGEVTSITNNATDGKLTLEGLPWGAYGVQEATPARGFAAYNGVKFFELGYKQAENYTVTYYFNSNDSSDNTLENKNTKFYVKKQAGTSYLSGVTLQICKKNGSDLEVVEDPRTGVKYEWTTQVSEEETGHQVDNLPQGTYVLHEVNSPATYILDPDSSDVTFTVDKYGRVQQTGNTITMLNQAIKLEIEKQDQYGELVEGAELTITGVVGTPGAGYRKVLTAPNTGEWTVTGLVRGGQYTITETTTPEGYYTMEPVTIVVNDKGTVISQKISGEDVPISEKLVLVDSKTLVSLKLKKADVLDQDKYLSGAVFTLYNANTNDPLLTDITMDTVTEEDGSTWIGWDIAKLLDTAGTNSLTNTSWNRGIGPGSYYLEETTAPGGYQTTERIEFNVNSQGILTVTKGDAEIVVVDGKGGETITIYDEPLTLQLQKISKGTSANLTGAVYRVSPVSGNNSDFVQTVPEGYLTISTDALERDNSLYGMLKPDVVYQLKEVTPPKGYIRSEDIYFKLSAQGMVTITNQTGDPISRNDVEVINPLETDQEHGPVLKLKDEALEIQIVKLSDVIQQPLEGASITITGDFADGTDSYTFTSGSEPTQLKGMLVEGKTYTLTEETMAGYKPLTGTVTFSYDTDTGLVLDPSSDSHAKAYNPGGNASYTISTLELTNESKQNTCLSLRKLDGEDESGISGAVFTLTYDPNDGIAEPVSTDYTIPAEGTSYTYETAGQQHTRVTSAGELFLTELAPGKYTLKEKEAPYGYLLGDPAFECTFTVDDTAKNQIITINSINAGNAYELTVVEGEEQLTEKGIENPRQTGKVTLQKVDEQDDTIALNDVGFTVYRYQESEGIFEAIKEFFTGTAYVAAEAVWSETQDADGFITIEGLPWGKYYIVETTAKTGYALNQTKYDFEIGRDRLSQVFEWEPATAITNAKIQLSIQQISSQGEAAQEQEHRLRLTGRFLRYTGNSIEWEVTEEPYIVAGELIPGETYVLAETTTYSGHTSALRVSFRYNDIGDITLLEGDTSIEIEHDADGNLRLVQQLEPLRIRIRKVNEDGKLLPGAELNLSHAVAGGDSEKLDQWTTDDTAYESIGQLKAGESYLLTETKAPEGYDIAEPLEIVPQDTTEWQEFVLVNTKTVVPKEPEDPKKPDPQDQNAGGLLPKTGREVRGIYLAAGGCLVILGIVLCVTGIVSRTRRRRI